MPLLSLQDTAPQQDEVPLLKTAIQRAIIATLRDGPYYQVTYTDGLPDYVVASNTRSPESVRCNEISARFSLEKSYGRSRVLSRGQWVFEALVQFKDEVACESMEDVLTREPFGVVLDGKPPVVIDLESVKYLHPTTSAASHSGTGVRFTFVASSLRR